MRARGFGDADFPSALVAALAADPSLASSTERRGATA